MTQYINKSALVAEIESKIEKYFKRGEESDAKRDGYGMYWGGVLSCLNEIRTLCDTLEVKEVYLDLGSPDGSMGVKTVWNGDKIISSKVLQETNPSDEGIQNWVNDNVPELHENEDERMKNEIIAFVEQSIHRGGGTPIPQEQENKWIEWLEKQGEQKPADKIEPKFKVGNWYQCTKEFFGKGVTFDKNTAYYCAKEGCLQNEYGCHIAIVKDLYDNFKLWAIEDAKDGDVLHCWIDGDEFVLIYKGIRDGYITTYGHLYQKLKSFSEEPTSMFCRTIQGHFTPATKEQRDLLFQKMKEAGYELDAENKELKKIEQGNSPLLSNSSNNGKNAWSEEDECNIQDIDSVLFYNENLSEDTSMELRNWLQSLKERIRLKNL